MSRATLRKEVQTPETSAKLSDLV